MNGILVSQFYNPWANIKTMHCVAFIAIGHTATAIGSDMKPFLDEIMMQIKQGLQGRG